MVKFLSLSLLLFFSTLIFSRSKVDSNYVYWDKLAKEQIYKNDSLYHVYATKAFLLCPKKSDQYLDVILQSANSAFTVLKLDTALYYLDIALPLLSERNKPIQFGNYYTISSAVNQYLGNLAKAESEALLAIKSLINGPKEELAEAYNVLSAVLYKRGKNKESLEALLKVPPMYAAGELSNELSRTFNNMGNIYYSFGDYQKALNFQLKCAEIDRKLGNFSNLLKVYNNIGISYDGLGKSDSSFYYYNEVINDTVHNYANSLINSKTHLNIGILHLNNDEYTKAIESFNRSKEICALNGDKVGIIFVLINLGEVYTEQSDYNNAEASLKQGLVYAKELGTSRYLEVIYSRLVEVSSKRKDYKKAFEYQTSYLALKDSIYDGVEIRVLENLEQKYEVERQIFQDSLDLVRQNNLLALSQEKRFQELESEQNIRNLLSICLLFSAGMFFLIYSKYRAQKKSNAIIDSTNEQLKKTLISKEEKELLLKEIHHRVKNNLQIISSLMRLQSNTTTDYKLKSNYQEMQDRINSMALVHEQLYGSNDFSTIKVSDYANRLIDRLQKVYSDDGVEVIKRIRIKELSIEVLIPLGLLVNELLTNCFKYAVSEDGGLVEVELSSNNDGKYLMIRDNGPGVEDVDKVFNKGTFGAELFKTLVEQLDGTYKITSDKGFKVEVFF